MLHRTPNRRMPNGYPSVGFLANRLYGVLGYPTPQGATDFIRYAIKQDRGYHIKWQNDPQTPLKTALVRYALGTPYSDRIPAELREEVERIGMSAGRIKQFMAAMKDPTNAPPDIIDGLELDEKVKLLNLAGTETLSTEASRLIKEGYIRE